MVLGVGSITSQIRMSPVHRAMLILCVSFPHALLKRGQQFLLASRWMCTLVYICILGDSGDSSEMQTNQHVLLNNKYHTLLE